MKVKVELDEGSIALLILDGYSAGKFIHNGTDVQYFNSADEAIKWATDIGYEVIGSNSYAIEAMAKAAGIEVVDVKLAELEPGDLSGLPIAADRVKVCAAQMGLFTLKMGDELILDNEDEPVVFSTEQSARQYAIDCGYKLCTFDADRKMAEDYFANTPQHFASIEPIDKSSNHQTSFPKGMTVKELKDLIKDWPETNDLGEATEVWIGDDDTCSPVYSVCPLNTTLDDNGKVSYDLNLSSDKE